MIKKIKNKFHKNITDKVSGKIEVPKEFNINLPLISMLGNTDLDIENYKGIIEYSDDVIRINISNGILKIEGRNLFLKQITSEIINITGAIHKLEFIN